jgi:hypothetical protein
LRVKIAGPSQVRTVQGGTEARRAQVEQGRNVQAKIYQVYGRMDFSGAGETTFSTSFPVMFLESPQLSFGGELGANQILTAGKFPRVNVMIRSWSTTRRAGALYYVGAELIVVADGPTDMVGIVHWQVEGAGLTNPLFGSGDVSTTE